LSSEVGQRWTIFASLGAPEGRSNADAKPFGAVSASDTASALRFMTKVVAATHGDPQDLCKPLSAPSALGAFSTYDTATFLNDPKNARAKVTVQVLLGVAA